MRFVDTNIPLYAISSRPAEAAKAERAVALLNAPDLALSVQVLQEFYVQATRSTAASPLSHDAAVAFIDTLRRFPVQEITVPLMQAALATRARWGISYWDATIVEAARSLACPLLLSEDLQHGQDFDGVLVQNPFL
ncbi:MAG: PIN domain-containing protein [Gammaproteobacteria bacterium]